MDAKVMDVCGEIESIIKSYGYKIHKKIDNDKVCIIDFRHPDVPLKEPYGYYLSSVVYNKTDGTLETTVRAKVNDYKELYLDYCCERDNNCCEMVCRPHVWMEERIVSVEAKFHENPIYKFRRLLEEMRF